MSEIVLVTLGCTIGTVASIGVVVLVMAALSRTVRAALLDFINRR